MSELFLVRHGETDSTFWGYPDKTPVIYGGYDVPLHENGKKEAQRAAVFLEKKHIDVGLWKKKTYLCFFFEVLVSSPLSRSVFGAENPDQNLALRTQVQYEAEISMLKRAKEE